MPEFPGGQSELFKYLGNNVKFPPAARNNGIQGKVYVNFSIMTNGSIEEVKTINKVHPLLDSEAIRVINSMPNWSPGIQKGKKVMYRYFEENNDKTILQIKEDLNNMALGEKERLIHYLIDTKKNGTLNKDESIIINNMYNIVKVDNDIWGYKTVNNKKIVYKKYINSSNGGIFIDPTDEELIFIKKSFEKIKMRDKPPAQIIGYYEYKSSDNSVIFKIRDKHYEGKKGTQKKTGSICNNGGMNKDKIF